MADILSGSAELPFGDRLIPPYSTLELMLFLGTQYGTLLDKRVIFVVLHMSRSFSNPVYIFYTCSLKTQVINFSNQIWNRLNVQGVFQGYVE